jgi:hypothetical protein
MKPRALALFLAACAAVSSTAGAAGWGGGRGSGRGGGRSFGSSRSTTIYKQRRVSVSRPAQIQRSGVAGGRQSFRGPARGETGARSSGQASFRPPSHETVGRNSAFVGRLGGIERAETQPGRYYWHNDGGMRYCHYYWGGAHWYGFYHGQNFYWTRYYGNRWWWYDGGAARWNFWWDGYWWWGSPGAYYVYVDNGYYPYDEAAGAVTVQNAEVHPAPAKMPAPGDGAVFPSPDGRRQVQIYGADAQAFLYDKSDAAPTFIKFLGKGADKVRFNGGSDGKPVQILIEFKDGTFAVYDEDGNSLDAVSPAPAAADKTEDSIPGPPPGVPSAPPTPAASTQSAPKQAPAPDPAQTAPRPAPAPASVPAQAAPAPAPAPTPASSPNTKSP